MSLQERPSGSRREYSDVVQVFEPSSFTLPKLSEYVPEVLARRLFISELANSEIKGSQSSTWLGELWALVDPVFQAIIYYFLFVLIRGGTGGGNSTTYITVIISSVFLFNFTRIAIADGGRAILRHRGLVLNSVFPRALLPVSEVYKGLLETWPALIIYALIHLALGAPITAALLALPLLIVIQSVMNLGFALFFSTLTVFFKDMSNLLNYILRILTFSTPVVWPVATLPANVKQFLIWNPLFPLFSAYQGIITGTAPSAGQILASAVWAAVLVTVGTWVFLRYERTFALHV
jgi:teichoic acid transport system permease protein